MSFGNEMNLRAASCSLLLGLLMSADRWRLRRVSPHHHRRRMAE